jgi:uncharacterized alpha-E superfamily protein
MVYDSTRTYGLGWNLKQMRRVVWHLKERLSPDTWRVLQQLERDFTKPAPAQLDQRLAAEMSLLDGIIVTLAALSGLIMENVTRGPGWRFLEIGRRLERSLQMAELLRSGLADTAADAEPYLQILLHIADSSITYRTRYLTVLRTDLVLDLLLSDETNPRSLAFQLTMLQDHILKLPPHEDDGRHSLEERLVLKALTAVRLASRDELAQPDDGGHLPALADLIQTLKADLYELSDTLTAQYLSHIMTAHLTSSF